MRTQNIKLEPHSAFKAAIQAVRPDGRLVYNYWRLIEACERLYGFSEQDAAEWVDYNIVGLAVNGFDIRYARLPAGQRPAQIGRRRAKSKRD